MTTWAVDEVTQAVFRKLSLDQSSAFDWLKQFVLLEKLRFSQNMYCKHVMMNILFVKCQIFKETFVFRNSETNIWSIEISGYNTDKQTMPPSFSDGGKKDPP